ncbi:MAG: hypothetical protein R3E89_15955 [Thiolinea sp.]
MATGVGKSSLLKAVIPQLKSASGKNLDVVYYKDWVTAPLQSLKAEMANTVRQSANCGPQGTPLDENLMLTELAQFCMLFHRPAAVHARPVQGAVRYRHKYHAQTFRPFIDALTELITATKIPVSLVFFSVRISRWS